jgi:hypothetical protein
MAFLASAPLQHVMPEAMTSPPAVLSKMLLDQLLMCPTATAVFFMVMRCWEGHPHDAVAYMRSKMLPTLKANYILWPLAHIINFAFVPPEQRILYCNAVGIAWTAILSSILNARTPTHTAAAAGTLAMGADLGGGHGHAGFTPARGGASAAMGGGAGMQHGGAACSVSVPPAVASGSQAAASPHRRPRPRNWRAHLAVAPPSP